MARNETDPVLQLVHAINESGQAAGCARCADASANTT
jgi:hypothetical protein